MTLEKHCRIVRVKMKNGGADLTILPPPKLYGTEVFNSGSGTVVIRSNTERLSTERALFLIGEAQDEIWRCLRENAE